MNPLFKPRRIEYHGKNVPLFEGGKPLYQIIVAERADPLILEAAEIVRRAINYPASSIVSENDVTTDAGIWLCTPKGPALFARLVERGRIATRPVNRDQAYEIEFLGNDIVLLGRTPQALIYAARTLAGIVEDEGDGAAIPEVTVYDYPDLAYRGIYVECRWGPDNMTLDDWKEAIDTLAAMRMNIIGIGLYNNWPAQYDGRVSEWMLVPIEKYPKLKTPQLVNYYSPSQKKDIGLEYVPRMYEEDLFGDIIKYAKSKGVIVRPHFNTPGHNTQIPRNYPETSAKYADGSPKKYGFCMSSPVTFEVMFGIFDEICDRYLLPNGIDMFHIGLDEVYPSVGMDPDKPLHRIDPWCECPDCKKTTPEDHFVNYALKLASHLKEKGINHIGMWHDSFVREGKMNEELVRRFEEAGLKDNVILHWWRYADFFDTTMPELGLRRWVVPMTGYFYWVNYQNYLENCFLAVEKGVEERAEGTEAYGVWHPSFHQHYALLAAKSWNSENWPDVSTFRARYARQLFGARYREGLKAFGYFDDLTAGPGMLNFLTRLFDYVYLYANWEGDANHRANYPQLLISQLVGNPLNMLGFLTMIAGYTQKALDIFSREGLWAPGMEKMRDLYVTECLRIKSVLLLFARMVNAVNAHKNGGNIADAADALDKAVADLDAAMLAIEQNWDPPFVPQALRELTLMRTFALDLSTELRSGPSDELEVMKITPVDWPND